MNMPKQLQDALLSYALPNILPPGYELKITSWDDIIKLGRKNIGELIWLATVRQVSDIADKKQNLQQQLYYSLIRVVNTSKDMPFLPQFRPDNYIKEGDKAVVFYPEKNVDRGVSKGTFIEGKVTELLYGIPRVVCFVPNKKYTTASYKEWTYLTPHLESPEIMKKTDFNALRRNPNFTDLWLTNLKESDVPNGYRERLLELVNQNKTY